MKTGKKRFIGVFAAIFLLVFAVACVFGACGSKEKEATVESVSVSPTSLELTLDSSGEASGTVTATVKMSDSSNYTGDITVGAVLGVSYAVSPMSGSSATITITATEPVSATSVSVSAGGKSASFTLTVNAYEAGTPEPEPEPGNEENYAVSVAAESSVTEVEVGSTLQLTASVTNNGTAVEGASVTWSQSSDDGGEVEFSETTSGLITGVTAGTVTITATYTPEGGEAVSGTITVTVKEVESSGTEHTHVYGTPVWTWNDDYTCMVTWTCTAEGCEEEGNVITKDAAVASSTTAATCVTDGKTVYTATYTATDGTVYTCTETKTVTIPATGHTYPATTQTEYFVWPTPMESVTENSTISITVKCSVCGNDIEAVTATITKIETTDATSDTNGKTVYTATATMNGSEVELSYEVTIPATGHSYPEATDTTCVVWDWENKTGNTVTVTIYCKDGDEHVMETGTVTFTTEVTKEPSCTENGVLTYTTSFTATGNGVTYTSTYDEDIEMTSHTAGTSTVFSDGSWYVACSVCGEACDDPLTTGEGYTFNVTTAEEIKAAAALDGAKIVLAGNITATVEISGTVSIDLSGYTLTGSGAHTITVKAGGVLTIEDTQENGVVDNVSTGCAAVFVEAGGEAKLVGGTYTRSFENGDGGTYYTIVNQGTMTINSPVKVETSAATTSSMIENGWATPTDNTTGATATLTIDGGTFSGGANHLVKNDDYGKLVISGGTFTGSGVSVILNYGELEISNGTFTQESTTNNSLVIWDNNGGVAYPTTTISGGTFVGGAYGTLYNDSTGTMKISGGTFENSLYAVVYSEGTLEISGGTFKSTGAGLYIYVVWAGDGTVNLTNGTFTAGDSSDVLVAAGGGAVVTISGGTFTGPGGATMLYTYKTESGEEITATITVTGGSFSAAPEGFLADGFAATYDETAGLYVVNKAPAYVADAAISDTEITLDLANGEDPRDLTITVVMSEEGSGFEGTVAWTITSGSDVIEIDENGGLSATITAVSEGEATITAEIEGTAFTFTVEVHVVDTTSKESGVRTSVSVDFSDTASYSWIESVTNGSTYTTADGLLTFMATASGTSTAMSITEATAATDEDEGADGYLTTAGATGSGSRYFQINLTEYSGSYVSVTVKMSDTGNNGNKSVILASAQNTSSAANGIAYASSESSSDVQTFTYVMYVTGDPLYITWSGGIRIYSIDIIVSDSLTPTPVIESASLTAENNTLTLVSGETVTTYLTLKVTVGGQETLYDGRFTVSSSDSDIATVSVGENGTITVTAVGIGTATISVSLWNAPSVEAACTITVEANYVGSMTIDPTSLTIEKGQTKDFTFSVSVTTKAGESYTGTYGISVESRDPDVANYTWDTTSTTVAVSGVGSGKTTIVVTISVDGIVLASEECAIEVTDADQTSLHIDFSDSSSYSSLFPSSTITQGESYSDWILTYVARSDSTIESGGDLKTGGKTSNGEGYFIIDLQNYVAKYVSISVTFIGSGTSSRSMIFTTDSSSTSTDANTTLAYKTVTSNSSSDKAPLEYMSEITADNSVIYITFTEGMKIYAVDIEILDSMDPEIQGVTLSKSSLTLQIGRTETAEITAAVEMNFGNYDGQYSWSVEGDAVTISGDGTTITVIAVTTIVESATATVTVSVGGFTASCVVTVLVAGDEPAGTEYTVHFTIGESDFTTDSEMPADEEDQVKLSYSNTYSASGKTGTYTDEDGFEYSYTKGIKVKKLGTNDVIITIPEEATNVTITIVGNTSSGRTMYLVDSDGETVESNTFSSQVESFTCTGLEGGVYHITASDDSYVLAVIITYTI